MCSSSKEKKRSTSITILALDTWFFFLKKPNANNNYTDKYETIVVHDKDDIKKIETTTYENNGYDWFTVDRYQFNTLNLITKIEHYTVDKFNYKDR